MTIPPLLGHENIGPPPDSRARQHHHHEGHIEWAEFERNQKLLAAHAYGNAGGVKSGRGGRALLPGVLLCAGCGCRLVVDYSGHHG